jgi:hypothetical protein
MKGAEKEEPNALAAARLMKQDWQTRTPSIRRHWASQGRKRTRLGQRERLPHLASDTRLQTTISALHSLWGEKT